MSWLQLPKLDGLIQPLAVFMLHLVFKTNTSKARKCIENQTVNYLWLQIVFAYILSAECIHVQFSAAQV